MAVRLQRTAVAPKDASHTCVLESEHGHSQCSEMFAKLMSQHLPHHLLLPRLPELDPPAPPSNLSPWPQVRFGVANITRPGFIFGVTFLPATQPKPLLVVTPAPGRPGCYLYKVSVLQACLRVGTV